jgi:GNAT superfamily N-acetyltransferase
MARINRWTVKRANGGADGGFDDEGKKSVDRRGNKLVITPRGKDVDEITALISSCFLGDHFDYRQETSGSFSHFLVYKIDGRIIALCSIYDKLKDRGFIMFGRLCVHPDYRGRHISHIIIDYLKTKYPVLVWTTNNPSLDKFYENIGGKKTGVRDGLVYWKWVKN